MNLDRIYDSKTGELLPIWKKKISLTEKMDKCAPFGIMILLAIVFSLLMFVVSPTLEIYGAGAAIFSAVLTIVLLAVAAKIFRNWKDSLLPINFSGSMDDMSSREIRKQMKSQKRAT